MPRSGPRLRPAPRRLRPRAHVRPASSAHRPAAGPRSAPAPPIHPGLEREPFGAPGMPAQLPAAPGIELGQHQQESVRLAVDLMDHGYDRLAQVEEVVQLVRGEGEGVGGGDPTGDRRGGGRPRDLNGCGDLADDERGTLNRSGGAPPARTSQHPVGCRSRPDSGPSRRSPNPVRHQAPRATENRVKENLSGVAPRLGSVPGAPADAGTPAVAGRFGVAFIRRRWPTRTGSRPGGTAPATSAAASLAHQRWPSPCQPRPSPRPSSGRSANPSTTARKPFGHRAVRSPPHPYPASDPRAPNPRLRQLLLRGLAVPHEVPTFHCAAHRSVVA
jgi:hypothetical protein